MASYDRGDAEFEQFGEMKINETEIDRFGYSTGNVFYKVELENLLFDVFEESEYFERFRDPKERVKKNEMREFFFYFYNKIPNGEYSEMDVFMNIADFFNIQYKAVYDVIGLKLQSKILREIDTKYEYLKKDLIKQLF